MLTKLTKTILAHDAELKVSAGWSEGRCLIKLGIENMGEPDPDGQGEEIGYRVRQMLTRLADG